jgi:hypothetical protein
VVRSHTALVLKKLASWIESCCLSDFVRVHAGELCAEFIAATFYGRSRPAVTPTPNVEDGSRTRVAELCL